MSNSDLHIELYKRYRPSRWGQLVGQAKVAKSLQTAVKTNMVPTAFLFSGERGTGKTSAALILAKAINCLNPIVETADPCNKCEVCTSIDNGTQLGVTYISAAQRSGVEDIKNLVSDARLSVPIKRQVFIIDEIHNLKQGKGFEALLIPLEEKGMPALFIFCTTEINKVPQTIISRVQSRRFNLVPADLMLKYIRTVGERENLGLSDESYEQAVREGRGSVRDTLTALEGITSTGALEASPSGKLLESLASHDLTTILTVVAEAASNGEDCRTMGEQLFEDLRGLLFHVSQVDPGLIGVLPIADPDSVGRGLFGKVGIMAVMDEVGEALTQMAMGADSRVHLEIGLVKALNKLKRVKKAIEARS